MITDQSRDNIKQAVALGERNIRALDHYDICVARRSGKKRSDVAKEFHISERQVTNITNCKCPEIRE